MSYRGFANYETHAIKTWLDTGSRTDQAKMGRIIERVMKQNESYSACVRELARHLSCELKNSVLDIRAFDKLPSYARDLIGNAMDRIHWEQIAEAQLEPYDFTDREDEDDEDDDTEDGDDEDDEEDDDEPADDANDTERT